MDDRNILLAMKKRGFGIGKWNGVGGKIDPEKGDKTEVDAIIRETKEEIGVDLLNPEKVGIMRFRFPYKPEWDQDVHLFLAKNWEGDPKESEEMKPEWFAFNKIPFSQMWDDDKYWLPYVLAGKKIYAEFTFSQGEKIDKHKIEII